MPLTRARAFRTRPSAMLKTSASALRQGTNSFLSMAARSSSKLLVRKTFSMWDSRMISPARPGRSALEATASARGCQFCRVRRPSSKPNSSRASSISQLYWTVLLMATMPSRRRGIICSSGRFGAMASLLIPALWASSV